MAESVASCLLVLTAVGCSSFPETVFRGLIEAMKIRYRIDPGVRRGLIDSLPFVVYLPATILGREPDLKVKYLSKAEKIGFEHVHEVQGDAGPRRLHVEIWEDEVKAGWDAEVRILATTDRGRSIVPGYSGSGSYSFAADETLVVIQLYTSRPESPTFEPYRLSDGELERFVDSFDAVQRSVVYRIPDAEEVY
jgi:hypothetical protein